MLHQLFSNETVKCRSWWYVVQVIWVQS